jgi:L-cysteine S-thiosulfotransferase
MKLLVALLITASAWAQPRSGHEYSSAEVRALQADDAQNPGMLWVDAGARLFARECASCHASMKGVATRYPRVVDGKLVNLETMARHRTAYAYESDDLLGLTAFLSHESRGMPIGRDLTKDSVKSGETEYFRRRGQMNLACTHCHDANAGRKLGGETMSEGQPNGYPAYRLEWQKLGSLGRRLRACMYGVHAEMPEYGAQILLDLEAYLAWRGRGLPVESPAVRR